MRKTTITAAALAMSASLAGLAYAAAPDGRTTEDSSVVTTSSPASGSTTVPTDDRGHGADYPVATPTPLISTGAHQRHDGDDDSSGRGTGGYGSGE